MDQTLADQTYIIDVDTDASMSYAISELDGSCLARGYRIGDYEAYLLDTENGGAEETLPDFIYSDDAAMGFIAWSTTSEADIGVYSISLYSTLLRFGSPVARASSGFLLTVEAEPEYEEFKPSYVA